MFREIMSLFSGWLEWPNWRSRIEVGLLFLAIYAFLTWLRGTRGERIIRALGLMLLLLVVGLVQLIRFLGLPNLEYLLDAVVNVLFIALVVLFQPELRRVLIRIGSRNPFLGRELDEATGVEAIASACLKFSKNKVGALIVLERQTGLKTYIESGTRIDAELSPALLRTIFFPGTALHDGAVIVRGGRLLAAGCLLPLSENTEISKALGTRHRAAVGLTEESDAVVVVVSEETGTMSLAVNGALRRPLNKDQLLQSLEHLVLADESSLPMKPAPAQGVPG